MNLTRDRMHTIGWGMSLVICLALTLALTFRVNAVKSQVRLAERQIAQLKQEKLFLETEFETRANQQQLSNINTVEFGYQAPSAAQYLEGERQLAALGKPRAPGAPSPIRVATAADVIDTIRPPSPIMRAAPCMVKNVPRVSVCSFFGRNEMSTHTNALGFVGQGRIQTAADQTHRQLMRAFDLHLWNRLDSAPAAATGRSRASSTNGETFRARAPP